MRVSTFGFSIAALALFFSACGDDGPVATGGAAGSTTTGGTAGTGAAAGTGATAGTGGTAGTGASTGTAGNGGCGGGCNTGECMTAADCAADEYCLLPEDCYPVGMCALKSSACNGATDAACGCNGTSYSSACEAAAAGESVHISVTECSDPPAGQFPCGTGYCKLGEEYCRSDSNGVACAAIPASCGGTATCVCVLDGTDCTICYPTKADGILALGCGG